MIFQTLGLDGVVNYFDFVVVIVATLVCFQHHKHLTITLNYSIAHHPNKMSGSRSNGLLVRKVSKNFSGECTMEFHVRQIKQMK